MERHTAQSINPATEETLAEYEYFDDATIRKRLEAATLGFAAWKKTGLNRRCELLSKLAGGLRESAGELAKLMSLEMGKPISEAKAEVEKCAGCADHFSVNAHQYLAIQHLPSDANRSYVRFDPLGTLLAIMPWNFPCWQVIRAAVPALAAGNVCVVKPASNVVGVSLKLEQIFSSCGFPDGAFQIVIVEGHRMEQVIKSPLVHAVTLTGSEEAGRKTAEAAGSTLKKVVLELGGSDPFIVLADADIEQAARVAAKARCLNTGQSCIAAKRFIVLKEVVDAFQSAFTYEMKQLRIGDPLNSTTQLGPLARKDLRTGLQSQVDDSINAGAYLTLGGATPQGRGYFYPATVLSGVRPGMRVFDQETFGPVGAIVTASDDDEAAKLANLSPYGLGSSIWTKDIERGEHLAQQIESGMVFLNGLVKSDVRLPFGGVKLSGFGRELSELGIKEFVNQKTVWIG